MIGHIFKRARRAPFLAIGLMIFAMALALAIGGLQASNEAEKRNYEEAYQKIPVTVTVTDLLGNTSISGLNAPGWFGYLFTGGGTKFPTLNTYVEDLIIAGYIGVQDPEKTKILCGVNSYDVLSNVFWESELNYTVDWEPGYDESVFEGTEYVCIVPKEAVVTCNEETGAKEMEMRFAHMGAEYKAIFTVAGFYTHDYYAAKAEIYYCPYPVLLDICSELKTTDILRISAISGTLSDSNKLEQFGKTAAYWFVEPNPTGEKTPWNKEGYEFYPYALKIDDTLLQTASDVLKSNLVVNQVCAMLVFIISAAAGFLIGFLMIRQRKREIALMRILGTRNVAIYFGFVLEQLVCVVVGTFLGGMFFDWNPLLQLVLLDVIYFVGLTAALQVFLNKNLLTTMKEDE